MAYRRRQGITRATTFKEEIYRQPPGEFNDDVDNDTSSSLAAQAIRASAAHRDSSLSSAYADSAFRRDPDRFLFNDKVFDSQESTSMSNNSRNGFWGILAKKAKEILEVEESSGHFESTGMTRPRMLGNVAGDQLYQEHQTNDGFRKTENPRLRKGLIALTTSLNQIGDTFEKAFEEGRTIVENKTADIIQETRKLQIRKKGSNSEAQNQMPGPHGVWQQPFPAHPQTNQETQLKASRDVAMATAAKAKLLLRELKTVKADLAFAKERCSQLEEENKILRESRAKGANPADDDLIRLQLETLLAEKARLAHENSVYARENRFLREIVEYHQLTMQDVVYLDEGIEEVTEVYPISFPGVPGILSASPMSPQSPTSLDAALVIEQSSLEAAPITEQPSGNEQILPATELPQERKENSDTEVLKNSVSPTPQIETAERLSTCSA